MSLNRKVFFDHVRASLFRGRLTTYQVEGMDAILSAWETRSPEGDLRWLAYELATTYHETGRTMQPVREAFYVSDDFAKAEAWRKRNLRYYPYYGRGFVQLTWRENYARAGKHLGEDLVNQPDLALVLKNAGVIMFVGMEEGWFRGDKRGRHTLRRYFNETVDDPVNARNIINGDVSSQGRPIAGYHTRFLHALQAASRAPAGPIAVPPVPTQPPQPEGPPVPPQPVPPNPLPEPVPVTRDWSFGYLLGLLVIGFAAEYGLDLPEEWATTLGLGLAVAGAIGVYLYFKFFASAPLKGSPAARKVEQADLVIGHLQERVQELPPEPPPTADGPDPLDDDEVIGPEADLPVKGGADLLEVFLNAPARQWLEHGRVIHELTKAFPQDIPPEVDTALPRARVYPDIGAAIDPVVDTDPALPS